MRTIRRATIFKRDYKREKRGSFAKTVEKELSRVVASLAEDRPLMLRHRDPPLGGQWKGHRNCHVRPDLVLICRKPDARHLDLLRLGSHSQLGL